MVQQPRDTAERDLAMEGYLRALRAAKACSVADRIARYQAAIPFIKTADERKTLLSGLSDLPCEAALKMVLEVGGDPAVKAEADFATLKIAKAVCGAYPELTLTALKPYLADGVEKDLQAQAQAIVDALGKFWRLPRGLGGLGALYSRRSDRLPAFRCRLCSGKGSGKTRSGKSCPWPSALTRKPG